MSVGLSQQRMVARRIRSQGTTGTLTRPIDLRLAGGQPYSNPAQLVGAHSEGASSITVDKAGLAGTVPAHSAVAIAGDATAYTTTAEATASAGQIVLPLTPVLAADAADDADVTLTDGTETCRVARIEMREMDLGRGPEDKSRSRYFIAAKGLARVPNESDRFTFDGATVPLYDINAVGSAGVDAYYDVVGGDA